MKPYKHFRSRKPQAVGEILGRTLKNRRLETKLQKYQGFSSWSEIVGKELAAVSFPERISQNGTLVVRVIDAVWSQELGLRKQELIEGYNQHGETQVINDIKFFPGDPKQFASLAAKLKD